MTSLSHTVLAKRFRAIFMFGLKTVVAIVLSYFFISGRPVSAQGPAPRGSYLKTCSNVAMRGTILSAHCSGPSFFPDGSLDVSACEGDIWNADSKLTCYARRNTWGNGHAIPSGSYLGSCSAAFTSVNGTVLTSFCMNRGKALGWTSVDLKMCRTGNNITNIDGRLVCVE